MCSSDDSNDSEYRMLTGPERALLKRICFSRPGKAKTARDRMPYGFVTTVRPLTLKKWIGGLFPMEDYTVDVLVSPGTTLGISIVKHNDTMGLTDNLATPGQWFIELPICSSAVTDIRENAI